MRCFILHRAELPLPDSANAVLPVYFQTLLANNGSSDKANLCYFPYARDSNKNSADESLFSVLSKVL